MQIELVEKRLQAELRRRKAETDFPIFAEDNLFIRTKSGTVDRLLLNRAQAKLHEALEKQRAETGKVRMLVGKGGKLVFPR